MSVTIYRDNDAKAIFIEDANGAQFLNSLQATVNNSLVSVIDTAKNFALVSDVSHNDIIDSNGAVYGNTPTEACDALNVIFQTSGSTGELPSITSNTTINLTEGDTLNYELTADYGVGYEWSNLPAGVVTVDGNVRKLVGGSGLSTGTYTPTVKAINYFGEATATITINVSAPPFSNTKSINFNNNDYLGANAALLDSVLGRSNNGTGSGDAWTISMYFKPGTATNSQQTVLYFGAQDVSNSGYVQIKYDGATNAKTIRIRYGTNNNRLEIVSPTGALAVGQWHHLMFTYDGGTTGSSSGSLSDYYSRFKIFIDGVEQITSNAHNNYGYTSSISGTNFRVGRWNTGQSLRNNSRIDELAIWDSDQSSNIDDIYNSGDPFNLITLTDDPKHWWRMGDGDTYPNLQDSGTEANCTFVMYSMTVADIVSDVP